MHAFGAGQRDDRRQQVLRAFGMRRHRLERASFRGLEIKEIGRFARLRVPDVLVEAEGFGARASPDLTGAQA